MKRPLLFHSNAVWPPSLFVGVFWVLYAIVTGCLWLINFMVGGTIGQAPDLDGIQRIQTLLLAGAAGLYAAYRLGRFHPACDQAYANWLRLSPWIAAKPLPLGPVHLVWQDAVVIGVLTALGAWHAHIDPTLPAGVFGLIYLIGMTLLLAFTRRWGACLVLGFLWPALILPESSSVVRIGLVAGIIVASWYGHRRSLQAFPWKHMDGAKRPPGSALQREIRIDMGTAANKTLAAVGWPLSALSPKVEPFAVSTRTSLWLSALIGWWSYCLMRASSIEPAAEVIVAFAVFAALIRIAIYSSEVSVPFNLWGRIAWGRLIVPGFDRILLTPVAAVLLGLLGGAMIKSSGSWSPVVGACVLALLWLVLLSGGPTRRNWVLTGQLRFRPPARGSSSKQALRQI